MNGWLTWILGIAAALVVVAVVVSLSLAPDLSRADAEQVALAQFPGAMLLETELEYEDGAFVYSVEMNSDGQELEITIDPSSGEVLAVDSDDDHEEADDADD